jgi:hypothetical protein
MKRPALTASRFFLLGEVFVDGVRAISEINDGQVAEGLYILADGAIAVVATGRGGFVGLLGSAAFQLAGGTKGLVRASEP